MAKPRLENGMTEAQAKQFAAARATRWDNADGDARTLQGRKMHTGMARHILTTVWPEALPEFERRLQAHGYTRVASHSGK